MSAETNRTPEQGERREALREKSEGAQRAAMEDALNLMHEWRFVPDEMELGQRVLYALTSGMNCSYLWVYKQIAAYIEKYGVEEFEKSVYPLLLRGLEERRYTIYEVRHEMEAVVVRIVKRMYGEDCALFFSNFPKKEEVEKFNKDKKKVERAHARAAYLMFQVLKQTIEEIDSRTVEVLVFFGHFLDSRIFWYLLSHFEEKEKDLALEILLVKKKYRETGIEEQKHLDDKEIESLFEGTARKSRTEEEEERQCREILVEMMEEEPSAAVYSIARSREYLQRADDAEIFQKIVEKTKDRTQAVRMACVVALPGLLRYKGAEEALLSLLNDKEEEIREQAILSIESSIGESEHRTGEMLDHLVEWVGKGGARYARYLPGALVKAKRIGHPSVQALYEEYCNGLLEYPIFRRLTLIASVPEVFEEFISRERVLEEELKEMQVEDKKQKTGVTFPSPEMVEMPKKKFLCENALSNLEEIVEYLGGTLKTPECLVSLLHRISPMVRRGPLERVLVELYRRDPERRWRYWTELMGATKRLKNELGEGTVLAVRQELEKLEKHWAYTVRQAAKECRAFFGE